MEAWLDIPEIPLLVERGVSLLLLLPQPLLATLKSLLTA